MAYTAKHTWTVGEVITASKMDAIEDNIQELINEVTDVHDFVAENATAIGELKSALMIATTYTLVFMQGGISSSTGSASTTNYEKRIRTVSNVWYTVAGGLTCTIPDGFRAVFYYYDYNAAGNNYTYKGSDGWIIGEYTNNTPIGDYLRVVMAREDDTNLTPEDVTTPVVVEALTATDETLSLPGKAADAKAVNEAIASCYKYGGLINESTDLDDLKTPGIYYRWTSSYLPEHCPTVYGGSVLCFGQTGVNYQLVINSAGDIFARGTSGTGDGSYTESWNHFIKQNDIDTVTESIAELNENLTTLITSENEMFSDETTLLSENLTNNTTTSANISYTLNNNILHAEGTSTGNSMYIWIGGTNTIPDFIIPGQKYIFDVNIDGTVQGETYGALRIQVKTTDNTSIHSIYEFNKTGKYIVKIPDNTTAVRIISAFYKDNIVNIDIKVEISNAIDAKAINNIFDTAMTYYSSLPDGADLNDATKNGIYIVLGARTYFNSPNNNRTGCLCVFGNSSNMSQIFIDSNTNYFYRIKTSSTWGSWIKLSDKYGALIAQSTLTSSDDLDDITKNGIWFYSKSSVPLNTPVSSRGGLLLTFVYNDTYSIQIVFDSIVGMFYRTSLLEGFTKWKSTANGKDQLHFSVVKGGWSKKGTRGVSGVLGICCDHIFELTPKSVLEFYLDEGWTYSIKEGVAVNDLSEQTAHLSNARSHIVKYPYVAINFNHWENGEAIETSVDDFDNSVIIRTSGTAITDSDEDGKFYHDFPESIGQMNVINRAYQMTKIQYVTEDTLPLHSGGSILSSEKIEDASPGTEITGIPYSSMRETMASIPQATSFHTFMTAILNKNSYIYTKHYEPVAPSYDYNSRCYYGAVCSTLVAYCYGIDNVIPTTISFDTYPGLNPLPTNQQNPYSLKLADMLNHSNDHIVIVTDIGRNYRGKIEYIEVTEAWKPLCRSVKYTPERIKTKYFDEGFVAYRYEYVDDVSYTPSPWVHIDSTESAEPVYSTTLSPRKGDKANWAVDETVEIDVMDSTGYTSYVLANAATETAISTASIPAGNVISLTGLTEGKYSVYLTDGTENGVPVYFDVINAEVTYTPLGNNQVKVEYTSAGNRVPSAVYWCANVQSKSDYKAVRAFHILTSEEVSAGYAIVDEPTDYRDADTVNGVWRMRMNFKTEFGLFASEMVEVSVT